MPGRNRLLARVRAALERVADPARAPAMQAYAKSAMPYHGVGADDMRRVCRAVFVNLTFEDAAGWQAAVLGLWRGARFREERYAAIELAGIEAARPFQTPDALPVYEEMIVTGAWWDLVDGIASHRIGGLLRHHPGPTRAAMLEWRLSEDLWKRRSSIICQLTFKAETDVDLLYACIEPSVDSREFFLRKAIGWALRQYAWTNPREVVRYVRAHRDRLSPLSKREALRNVIKAGMIRELP